MTTLSLIAAMARHRVIGVDNRLPWHVPEDLQHFKRITLGKPIIMGRRTWVSLGRPLPGRHNIVLTRQSEWVAEGATVVTSLDAALIAATDAEEVFVIGGAELYQLALPRAQRIYLTEIELDVVGDAYFPPLDTAQWQVARSDTLVSQTGVTLQFVDYVRAQ